MKRMAIENKLALNVFHTEDNDPHIEIDKEYADEEEIHKVVLACPAECYKYIDGKVTFSHLGCLECGTCRVLSHGKLVKSWNHPFGSVGVLYRQG